jgi:hypothetical protein
MPELAVAFFILYWMLLQEVLDVRVIAPEQLSFDGCAKTAVENNKQNKKKRAVFL